MSDSKANFEALAKEAGLPTTETALNAEFEILRVDAGLNISNKSAFGPFWRFVNALATKTALWLVRFIVDSVLPQAFVKTATGYFLDVHAWAVDLTRKLAKKATGFVEFTRTNTVGTLAVPAGVVIQSTTINGQVYSLVTLEQVQFPDGAATILAPIEAVESGDAYNLGEGYYTVLPLPVSGVTGVNNLADWLTLPGADEETDDDLRARIRNQYTAINQWHTDAVYTAIIAGFEGVTTSNIFFEHGAPRGPGTANAYVMLEAGNPTQALINSIQAEITDTGNHGHGDDLLVYAMPETTNAVTCTVWPVDNLNAAAIAGILSDVEDFIRCAFRENSTYTATKTKPWALFSFSILSQELHAEFGLLKNVAFDLSHIESGLNIPRLGILAVNQNA